MTYPGLLPISPLVAANNFTACKVEPNAPVTTVALRQKKYRLAGVVLRMICQSQDLGVISETQARSF